jgi:hypothetical protein
MARLHHHHWHHYNYVESCTMTFFNTSKSSISYLFLAKWDHINGPLFSKLCMLPLIPWGWGSTFLAIVTSSLYCKPPNEISRNFQGNNVYNVRNLEKFWWQNSQKWEILILKMEALPSIHFLFYVEGEHSILSLINIETVRTLAEKLWKRGCNRWVVIILYMRVNFDS